MANVPIDGYVDAHLIGRGGFSRVYRARETEFDRDVALKVLDIDVETDGAKRVFARECELAGRLTDHPNVITVFGSGFVTDTSEPYIAMAYASGGSLSGRLVENGHLDAKEAVSIAIQIAGALETAHRHGVIHRDVKPQNIVFQRSGAPALTDFGIAAVAGFAATSMSAQAFTPLHAAPELFKGEPSSSSSDVYGLGSTLYCMLEGRPPFGELGDMPMAVLMRVMSDPTPPITTQKVPKGLSDVIDSMLAKNPDERPRLTEVIDQLQLVEANLGANRTEAVILEGDATVTPPPGADDHTPSAAASSWDRTTLRAPGSNTGRWVAAALVLIVAAGVIAAIAWPRPHSPAAVDGKGGVVQIDAAEQYSCAIVVGGRVKCWGQNKFGELGNGTQKDSAVPTEVVGINDATQISVSATHTCALRASGVVQCWGQNTYGELGNGEIADSSVPVTANISNVKQIAAAEDATCALIDDGSVQCWGHNRNGLLGRGTKTGIEPNFTPEPVIDVRDATQLAAGDWFICALISDGTARCWGGGDGGALGNGLDETTGVPQTVKGLSNAVELSAGYFHSCALLDDGTAKCWGLNDEGQLGNGSKDNALTPTLVKGLSRIAEVAPGQSHTCARMEDNTVKCWGSNEFGQLGADSAGSTTPINSTMAPRATHIASGDFFTCAGTTSLLRCWGQNNNGQLANGNKKVTTQAVTVNLLGGPG